MLNLDQGNQEQPFTKLDQETIYIDKETRSSFSVSLDLTKRRYNLLIKVKGLITNTPQLHMLFVMLIALLF